MWRLDSAKERHERNPDTFEIPDPEDLLRLRPGDYAKLLFCAVAQPEIGAERMWVRIDSITDDSYHGTLANDPIATPGLRLGDHVEFADEHIASVLKQGE